MMAPEEYKVKEQGKDVMLEYLKQMMGTESQTT